MQQNITTTFKALTEAEPSLRQISGYKFTDVKARYHLAKLLRLVLAECTAYREQFDSLIKEYGKERAPTPAEQAQRGNENLWQVTPENLPTFFAELKKLQELEVTIPWGPMTTEMLDSCLEATAQDLIGLGPFLEI